MKLKKILYRSFICNEEGSIYVPFLFIFLGTVMVLIMFCSIFVYTAQTYKVTNIVERAVELRAQQIDIPLKEGFGIIEAIHPSHQEGYPEADRDLTLEDGYDYQIIKPSDSRYSSYRTEIDQDIKESIVEQINKIGDKKLKTTTDDICIKVFPLPEGKGEKMDISCMFDDGSVETKTFYVDGKEHSSNKSGNYKVENAVVIFVKYEIENKMASLFTNNPVKERVATAIAYPLIEQCAVRSGC